MHPRIAEVLGHSDAQRETLRAAVSSVPPDKHAIAPDGRWSVLGVLEHLALTETRVAGLLRKVVAEGKEKGLGRETETAPVIPGMNLRRLLDRTNRLAAPEMTQPRSERTLAEAWRALDESRAAFRAAVLDADGFALREITYPHLYFGPLDMYTWIAFVGSHEARHADQIREIGNSLGAA